jgi:hypothetical protein
MLKLMVFVYRGGVKNGQQVFLLWKRKSQRFYTQSLTYQDKAYMETEYPEG